MKPAIRKYRSWDEITKDTQNTWKDKSSQERLAAMEVLVERIFMVRPELLRKDARPFPDIYPIVKRRKR
jgi:hypothetical protein